MSEDSPEQDSKLTPKKVAAKSTKRKATKKTAEKVTESPGSEAKTVKKQATKKVASKKVNDAKDTDAAIQKNVGDKPTENTGGENKPQPSEQVAGKPQHNDENQRPQNKRGRNRNRGNRQEQGQPQDKVVKLDNKKISKRAWKIFLGEVNEEGLALIADKEARELAKRSLRVAEIYTHEEALNSKRAEQQKKAQKQKDKQRQEQHKHRQNKEVQEDRNLKPDEKAVEKEAPKGRSKEEPKKAIAKPEVEQKTDLAEKE